MIDPAKYFDPKAELYRKSFKDGLAYASYIDTGSEIQQAKWKRFENIIKLSPQQDSLVTAFKRPMNVLVLSGIWCGECARQAAMLEAIVSAAPGSELRFVENHPESDLVNELRINGAKKVPVVVCLSEDFFEVARFGDLHLSVYRKRALSQLGAACDAGVLPPPEDELASELQDWIDFFERAHTILRLSPMLRSRYGD
ncbi:MAG: thioredoxin family protein [Bdellovibrionales bacterium]|nr:thioredoxin family protein [Bdellovibrionales bacterium]